MKLARRDLLRGAAALTLVSGIPPGGAAQAQIVSAENLMNPGPLPDRVLGAPEARVTIIEYFSLTCVYCAQFAVTTFPELKARYIDSGKVRYILREYPIDGLAVVAAMLPRCSGDEYFAAVDTLLRQQDKWVANRIEPLRTFAADALGFTEQRFDACVGNQQLRDDLEQARDRASKVLGVKSVPCFFINGRQHAGARSIKDMERLIDPLLRG